MSLFANLPHVAAPLVWTFLAVVGVLGAVALFHPRLFTTLATHGNHWVDTSKLFSKLDTRLEVDARVLPYSRVLGALVLVAVGVLAFVAMR